MRVHHETSIALSCGALGGSTGVGGLESDADKVSRRGLAVADRDKKAPGEAA